MIISKSSQRVSFLLAPINNVKPSKISKIQINVARNSAAGIRKCVPNISKYSTSLYEKPRVSLALMNPEKINNTPTRTRAMFVIIFILEWFEFYVIHLILSMQKQHN